MEEISQRAESTDGSSLSRRCFRCCRRTGLAAADALGIGGGILEDPVDAGCRLFGGTPGGGAKGGGAFRPLL